MVRLTFSKDTLVILDEDRPLTTEVSLYKPQKHTTNEYFDNASLFRPRWCGFRIQHIAAVACVSLWTLRASCPSPWRGIQAYLG